MLNGQKLQGPETAKEVNILLKHKNIESRYIYISDLFYFDSIQFIVYFCLLFIYRFPLFTAIHKICTGQMAVIHFIDEFINYPFDA